MSSQLWNFVMIIAQLVFFLTCKIPLQSTPVQSVPCVLSVCVTATSYAMNLFSGQ